MRKWRHWLPTEHRWFTIVPGGKVESMGADGGGMSNKVVGICGIGY